MPACVSRLRRVLAVAALLSVLAPAAAFAQEGDVACTASDERQAVALINAERAARGLAPLRIDVRLTASSLRHAEDMRDGCFLSHTGSDGSRASDRVDEAGYPARAGEVAGAGQSTAERIVEGWMGSSGHFSIIMGASATHIGIAHAETDSLCTVRDYGFLTSHFWVANVGRGTDPAWSEEVYCGPYDPDAPPECNDGLDNDGDGLVDFVQDPECLDEHDRSERPACDDGLDNDGDGAVDYPEDPGCAAPEVPVEDPDCSDGRDNDGDGLTDHPADPECLTAAQFSELSERCGLGFELALLLPPLMAWRRRRSRG